MTTSLGEKAITDTLLATNLGENDARIDTIYVNNIIPHPSLSTPNLQNVTDEGNTTTNSIQCAGVNSTGLIQTAGAVDIYSDGDLTANNDIEATNGDIRAPNGGVACLAVVQSGAGFIANSGGFEAVTGDIEAPNGKVEANVIKGTSTDASGANVSLQAVNAFLTGGLTCDPAGNGDLRAQGVNSDCIVGQDMVCGRNLIVGNGVGGGSASVEGNITTINGDIEATNGSISLPAGGLSAFGSISGDSLSGNACGIVNNITSSNGNITAATGNIQAQAGDISGTTLTLNSVDFGTPATSQASPANPNVSPATHTFDLTGKTKGSYWLFTTGATKLQMVIETGITNPIDNCSFHLTVQNNNGIAPIPYLTQYIITRGVSSPTTISVELDFSTAPLSGDEIRMNILMIRD